MRIGGRLLLLLAVPLVGLVSLTGYTAYSGSQDWRAASVLKDRTAVGLASFDLSTELQAQRSALIDGAQVAPESLARAEKLRRAIDDAMTRGSRAEVSQSELFMWSTALAKVDGAERVAGLGLGGNAAINSMSSAVDAVLDLGSSMINPDGAVDPRPASTVENLARAQAASSEERDRLLVSTGSDAMDLAGFETLIGLSAAQRSHLGLAAATAPDALAVRIDRANHGVAGIEAARTAAFQNGSRADLDSWRNSTSQRTDELVSLGNEAGTQAMAVVENHVESSRRIMVTAGLAALAVVIITAFLLVRALRSIAKPLEELAARAEHIALVDLPEAVNAEGGGAEVVTSLPAIRVNGAAEVEEVAAAFTDVGTTALRLASEQAALRRNQSEALTNLGRRNQTLLARQLDYLSSAENEETDPRFLEHLFRLDHLASRMRRNAESLLILAGGETPRMRRNPAKVSEVVRAAMSEVEDFERVQIGELNEDVILGPVAIDVIHLLAELIENGLSFSPPESSVIIEGSALRQGGYQFAIVDRGVGMADVDLTAANKRLAGLDELDGMPTRYLGQYVVAKLAKKLGAVVRLMPGIAGRGVSAVVTLPATSMVGGQNSGRIDGGTPQADVAPNDRVSAIPATTADEPAPWPLAEPVATQPVAEPSVDPDIDLPPPPVPGRITRVPVSPTAPPPTPVAPRTSGIPNDGEPGREWDTESSPDVDRSTQPVLEWRSQPVAPSPVGPLGGSSLQRRVPGASLAASRPAEDDPTHHQAPERSAAQVRSALASFQAGRTRGRGGAAVSGAVETDAIEPDGSFTGAVALGESDTDSRDSQDRFGSDDWRSNT